MSVSLGRGTPITHHRGGPDGHVELPVGEVREPVVLVDGVAEHVVVVEHLLLPHPVLVAVVDGDGLRVRVVHARHGLGHVRVGENVG